MQVSLIGSNGLLASSIGKYCQDMHYKLHVYGRNEPESYKFKRFIKIDLLKEKLNYDELAKSDVIVYAAGSGIQFHLKENSDTVYFLNVMIPVQLYNGMKGNNYRGNIITLGSYFEIGENSGNQTYTELDVLKTDLKAPNDYTISKRMLSRFVSSYDATFKFFHFILPTIYSENESRYRLIPYTIKSILEDRQISLTSGDQVRQYIYVEDVVKLIFDAIISNIASGIYNMKSVEEFTVKTLVESIFGYFNKKIDSNMFGKTERSDTGMKSLKLDFKKFSQLITFIPTTLTVDIYEKYIQFYNSNDIIK